MNNSMWFLFFYSCFRISFGFFFRCAVFVIFKVRLRYLRRMYEVRVGLKFREGLGLYLFFVFEVVKFF